MNGSTKRGVYLQFSVIDPQKEGNPDICDNMDKLEGQSQEDIPHYSTYMRSLESSDGQGQKVAWWVQGAGEERMAVTVYGAELKDLNHDSSEGRCWHGCTTI